MITPFKAKISGKNTHPELMYCAAFFLLSSLPFLTPSSPLQHLWTFLKHINLKQCYKVQRKICRSKLEQHHPTSHLAGRCRTLDAVTPQCSPFHKGNGMKRAAAGGRSSVRLSKTMSGMSHETHTHTQNIACLSRSQDAMWHGSYGLTVFSSLPSSSSSSCCTR